MRRVSLCSHGSMLSSDDIEQILSRSSKVVWSDTQAKKGISGPSSFSKATFQSSNADSEIDINDPNFWDLVLPEAKTAERLLQKLDKEDSLATEEQRSTFLQDLKVLVEEVEKGFREGKFENIAHTRNVLMKVSLALEITKPCSSLIG